MKGDSAKLGSLAKMRAERPEQSPEFCVGKVVETDERGNVFVTHPALSGSEPVKARVLAGVFENASPERILDCDVLIVFDGGDPSRPIVVGEVRDAIFRESGEFAFRTDPRQGRELFAGERKIALEAHDEISLRCGKASITMKSNGKVIVKGVEIVSRAARANKIKGGTVAIN